MINILTSNLNQYLFRQNTIANWLRKHLNSTAVLYFITKDIIEENICFNQLSSIIILMGMEKTLQ